MDESEFKDDIRVNPFYLLNKHNYTTDAIRNERYNMCKTCKFFMGGTRRCSICGCFMAGKTWVKQASCPHGLWHATDVTIE